MRNLKKKKNAVESISWKSYTTTFSVQQTDRTRPLQKVFCNTIRCANLRANDTMANTPKISYSLLQTLIIHWLRFFLITLQEQAAVYELHKAYITVLTCAG